MKEMYWVPTIVEVLNCKDWGAWSISNGYSAVECKLSTGKSDCI